MAATLLASCGPGGRDDDVRSVTERFQRALEGRAGERACALLTTEARTKLEQQEGSPCAEAIVSLELPPAGAVSSARVFVTSAVAHSSTGAATFLSEGSLGWRVSASGCRPGAPDQPYDCVMED